MASKIPHPSQLNPVDADFWPLLKDAIDNPALATTVAPGAESAAHFNAVEAVLGLTATRILFGGASGLAASSASLAWDDTGKALAAGGAFSTTEIDRASLVASTPFPSVSLDLTATKTWATGALSGQADMLIKASSHAFAAASTNTNPATLAISGPPIAGANCTMVNALSLDVKTGNVRVATGFLGIGTSGAPARFLHIGDNSASVGMRFSIPAANWDILFDTTTKNVQFAPGGAPVVSVTTGGNLLFGGIGAGGGSAANCLVLSNTSTPPTASVAMAHLYSSNGNGANTACLSIWQEYAPYAGIAVASTTKIPARANGTTYYLLATTVP
jgi:hypothetical protein